MLSLWRVVKLTPRVNTQRAATRASSSVTWNDVAGLSEVTRRGGGACELP